MTRAIRHIVFDLGGVVVRICRSWEEACERAGIPVREPERFASGHLREKRRTLTDSYMSGHITCDDYFLAIADATEALYSAEEVQRIHDIWLIGDYPGIDLLIRRINATPGMTSACLSNTNHAHWQALISGANASGAISHLGVHLVSHELGAVKPHAEIYRRAERILEASSSEIVFFDDTREHVEGARACGWRAEQIDHAGDPARQIERHLASLGIVIADEPG